MSGLDLARPQPDGRIVALAGNPNVGKSTLFNALTGLRQHTGNWSGKTVELAQGVCRRRARPYLLVDLPGTYSLSARSAEEEIARDFLASGQADAAVVVCDATRLERTLIFALQVLEQAERVVVCVNLMDEARRRGARPDLVALGRLLGVPVVGVSAGRGEGLDRLLDAVEDVMRRPPRERETRTAAERAALAERYAALTVRRERRERSAGRRADRLLTSRATGVPVMLALLGGILWLTVAGANVPSQWLFDGFGRLGGALTAALARLGASETARAVLIDGVWRVLSWVVSVMLPPIAIFFPLFTILEDLGYLPRVAFVLDRAFCRAGACGKQALTMAMGLGCNACGVTGCRIIDSPRERIVAILTNPLVPCNGRFPMLISLVTLFFLGGGGGFWRTLGAAGMMLGVLTLGVGMTLAVSRLLTATVLRGAPSSFTLELPPYRRPRWGQVAVRSVLDRTLFVLGRAAVVAAPAGLLIWLCANVSVGGVTLLARITGFLDPVGRALGMDGVILMAFLLGWPANEIVVPVMLMGYLSLGTLIEPTDTAALHALLIQHGWTRATAVCTILFSLFHWPCSTTCLTVARETRSVKWTLLAILLPAAVGACLCAAVAAVGRML